MIPLVGNVTELRDQKAIVQRVAEEVMKKYKVKLDYKIGTMIEVPRAAVTAETYRHRSRLLLVWYERPYPNGYGLLA